MNLSFKSLLTLSLVWLSTTNTLHACTDFNYKPKMAPYLLPGVWELAKTCIQICVAHRVGVCFKVPTPTTNRAKLERPFMVMFMLMDLYRR